MRSLFNASCGSSEQGGCTRYWQRSRSAYFNLDDVSDFVCAERERERD